MGPGPSDNQWQRVRPIGLYEELVTEAIAEWLDHEVPSAQIEATGLDPAEAADRIALHLGRLIARSIAGVGADQRVQLGINAARSLLGHLDDAISSSESGGDKPIQAGTVLRGLFGTLPDGTSHRPEAPSTPLLDTALLTNAPGEPNIAYQLNSEIPSADSIDVVMAFVVKSGIRPVLDRLRRHTAAGRSFRVLTTTFTGVTQSDALQQLVELGAQVRVSYDTTADRLHAKAWLFHRRSGMSTAFIGSSNMTFAGQERGMEWNVRAAAARNPHVIERVQAVFQSYWEGGDFLPFDPEEFERSGGQVGADRGPTVILPPTELRLRPFQERLLEQVTLARSRGHHRNLLVAATGTGKTVMAAVDFARLSTSPSRPRLLFVAHRKEILHQSLATFRYALRDAGFGELWVGGKRPTEFDHVFASVQSLHTGALEHLPPDHFDVVIVDEFHHAAAPTYERLLEHVRPRELLGLTATPERADGASILRHFDGRIAAELRLWDAIDQHRLSPFRYFGVHDGMDLSEIPWKRGRGYDVERLTNLYTSDEAWARGVLQQLMDHVDDVHAVKCLGFCVSVEHARFMARVFNDAGVASVAVWSDSPEAVRSQALRDLAAGHINVVFSVDLFNEGVDVPVLDTVLFLRPTDSPTLFLQQLGRGLRLAPDKGFCTVLDFVGQHRTEFRFDRRIGSILGGSRRELAEQVAHGFPRLPAGCTMQLDRVASEIVLRSIKESVPSSWKGKVAELVQAASSVGADISLHRFLDESGLDLADVYRSGLGTPPAGQACWSDLRAGAQLPVLASRQDDLPIRRALGRLLHADDESRLQTWTRLLTPAVPPALAAEGERERRLARMLLVQLFGDNELKTGTLDGAFAQLWRHPQLRSELLELLPLLGIGIDHVHPPWVGNGDVPLELHARYTRREIQAALGDRRVDSEHLPTWREGVRWMEASQADVFAFTLEKTPGHFSPTTRYQDYAISPDLIHWESQNATTEDGPTGTRYRTHHDLGTSVFMFARLSTQDRASWFLGPADYVSHVGERPMAITWRLRHQLPGDLFASFAAAVA